MTSPFDPINKRPGRNISSPFSWNNVENPDINTSDLFEEPNTGIDGNSQPETVTPDFEMPKQEFQQPEPLFPNPLPDAPVFENAFTAPTGLEPEIGQTLPEDTIPERNEPKEEWERFKSLAHRLYGKDRVTNNGRSIWLMPLEEAQSQNTSLLDNSGIGGDTGEPVSGNGMLEENDWLQPGKSQMNVQQAGQMGSENAEFSSQLVENTDPFQLANMAREQGRESEPGQDSTVHSDFRTEIAWRESRGGGYGAVNGSYLGKYQLGPAALTDAGFKDSEGNWTGKDGVHGREDFLGNKQAQEDAMENYVGALETHLNNNGAVDFVGGNEFPGVKGQGVRITLSGLVAASHRQGARAVREYLKFQSENGWSSNFPPELKEKYEATETRIREFQNISHR